MRVCRQLNTLNQDFKNYSWKCTNKCTGGTKTRITNALLLFNRGRRTLSGRKPKAEQLLLLLFLLSLLLLLLLEPSQWVKFRSRCRNCWGSSYVYSCTAFSCVSRGIVDGCAELRSCGIVKRGWALISRLRLLVGAFILALGQDVECNLDRNCKRNKWVNVLCF